VTTRTILERTDRQTDRTSLRDTIVFCLLVFLALRALTLVAAAIAGAVPSMASQGVAGWAAPPVHPGWSAALSAFERFDALWFLRIAQSGYVSGDGSAAFFPGYPLAIRTVAFALGGRPYLASELVSNGAFVAALAVLYRLTEDELGRDVARWSVVFLAVFPTAYFFVFPYSESLFLLFVVMAFLAARRRWWLVAGLAAALAAFTRSIGIVLAPALLIEALHQREEGRGPALPGAAAAGATALGTVAYAGWWQVAHGDWLIPLVRQQNWQRELSWPWHTLSEATRIAWQRWGGPGGGYWVFDLAVIVPVLIGAVLVATRFRPSYGVYVWGSLLAPMTFVFAGRPLMSMPRFVLTCFPVVWILARATHGRTALRWGLVLASSAALIVLCVLTIDWFYVF
jgi:dolichyl-phosphate-mannose-protein mannosyltransferase